MNFNTVVCLALAGIAFAGGLAVGDPLLWDNPGRLIGSYRNNVPQSQPKPSTQWSYFRYNNANSVDTIASTNVPTRGIIQNLIDGILSVYEEIINRQQQLLEIIYCTNCNTNKPWSNFLTVMGNIPALSWVTNPTTQLAANKLQEEGQGTFIAATYVNGVISGVGGILSPENEPIVQYTFTNSHVYPAKAQTEDKIDATSESATTTTNTEMETTTAIIS